MARIQLKYFQPGILGAYLIDAWQTQLRTSLDPTSGKWLATNPNNQGLLGGLADELAGDLVFGSQETRVNRQKELAFSATLDNRDGRLPSGVATVNWRTTNTTYAEHSTSQSIHAGISEKITVKGTVGMAEVGSETTFSFDYSYSWTNTEANTLTDEKSFSVEVPVAVPERKAYKLEVVGDRDKAAIPYSARVYLTGTSYANFPTAVQSSVSHKASAGQICRWIKENQDNKYGLAGTDLMNFDWDPNDHARGIADLRGTMRVDQAVNFLINVLDVTDLIARDPAGMEISRSSSLRVSETGVAVPHRPISRG